jgi:K+-sensing histidine kinase KdpD
MARRTRRPAKAPARSTARRRRATSRTPGGHDRDDLEQSLAEAREQLAATDEILKVMSRSRGDLQPVLDTVAVHAARLCEATDAQIFRLEHDAFRLVAFHGPLIPAVPVPVTRGSVTGRAVIDRQTIHIHDAAALSDREYPDSAGRRLRLGTVLAEPLLRDGQPIGVILIRRMEVRPFSERHLALLKSFAAQAVIAIENVRLYTEVQARNHALTEALDQQTATADILRAISASPTDLGPVLSAVAGSAARFCGADDVSVFRLAGGLLRRDAHQGPLPHPEGLTLSVDLGSVGGRTILERRTVHITDLQAETEEFPEGSANARRLGFRALLSVPLMREGQPIGVIQLRRAEGSPFTDKQIALLQIFADQAVIAIENVRLFTELGDRNRELTDSLTQQTATAEILRVISSARADLQPVLDTVVASAARYCGAYDAQIWRRDGDVLRIAAHHGPLPSPAGGELPLRRDAMSGRCVLDCRAVHVADVRAAAAEYPRSVAFARGLETRASLCVPMMREGVAIGTLQLRRGEPTLFTEQQIALLHTFADQAVIAIENVRLFSELESRTSALTRSVEQLTALGEVGRAVSSTLDLNTVLTTIVSRAVQISGVDGGVVFEYDDETEAFVPRAATETGAPLAQARRTIRVRKGEGALGRTAITLEPVQVPDITAPGAYEGRMRRPLIESGVHAILAVPMLHEGRLVGCLGVTRNRPGEFPPDIVELLRTFATQSALAIENARLYHEIADQSRQLEAASRHKSEFLANMSHELRTPLNAIIGFSEVLLQRMFGAVNDKQDEYLRDIHVSGQHLLSLINDILDLAKIEAGRMELARADFDLPGAIENALALVRERASRRGVLLERALDPALGVINADERKVKQILLNLLSNALKFTPEGGRIDVEATRAAGAAVIAVRDTGVGIAPEDHEAVFEEFRQVGESHAVEGTGLGLALSRKFVELHGGRIWVESELGHGSTFRFTLPLAPAAGASA